MDDLLEELAAHHLGCIFKLSSVESFCLHELELGH